MTTPAARSETEQVSHNDLSSPDVTILLLDNNGKQHQYHANRTALRAASGFFAETLTPALQELKLRGDNKQHMELFLGFIQAAHYDVFRITQLAAAAATTGDVADRIRIPMGICSIAEKYRAAAIHAAACANVRSVLLTQDTPDFKLLKTAVALHFRRYAPADTAMGRLIVEVAMDGERAFLGTEAFEGLVVAFPGFAVDFALVVGRGSAQVRCAG